MNLTVQGKELEQALKWVSQFVARRNFDLLKHVRIEAGVGLTLTACDGERFGRTVVHSVTEEAGCYAVRADALAGSFSPSGTVEIVKEEGRIVVSQCGRVTRLPFMAGDEFPPVPEPEGEPVATTPEFWKGLRAVELAAEDDMSRPYLMDVNLSDGTAVATDTRRMHVWRTGTEMTGRLAAGAAKAAAGMDAPQLYMGEERAWLQSPGSLACIARHHGAYPGWERVVPQESTLTMTMDKEELKSALSFLAGKAMKLKNGGERLEFTFDGSLQIYAFNEGYGETTAEVPALGKNAEGACVAMDRKLVADAMEMVTGDAVCMQMVNASRPVVFSSSLDDRDSFAIVMPMALN